KVSAICLLVIEPNKRPPSPDFAFNSTVNFSNWAFNCSASCFSSAACSAFLFSCAFNLRILPGVASSAKLFLNKSCSHNQLERLLPHLFYLFLLHLVRKLLSSFMFSLL